MKVWYWLIFKKSLREIKQTSGSIEIFSLKFDLLISKAMTSLSRFIEKCLT